MTVMSASVPITFIRTFSELGIEIGTNSWSMIEYAVQGNGNGILATYIIAIGNDSMKAQLTPFRVSVGIYAGATTEWFQQVIGTYPASQESEYAYRLTGYLKYSSKELCIKIQEFEPLLNAVAQQVITIWLEDICIL